MHTDKDKREESTSMIVSLLPSAFRALISSVFVFICVHLCSSVANSAEPGQVFERRIVPIFKSPNPSSCVQCHLSGVDLKNYILPSSEKTFLSLRDQGLIDVKDPAASKILKLIDMHEDKRDGANLIH